MLVTVIIKRCNIECHKSIFVFIIRENLKFIRTLPNPFNGSYSKITLCISPFEIIFDFITFFIIYINDRNICIAAFSRK